MALAESIPAAAEASAQSAGLPQLNFAYWPGEIVWSLAIFAALYFVLSAMFLPRLRAAIRKRGETIAEALAEARALRLEADAQTRAAHEEMTAARARAHKLAAEAKARAKAEAAAREAKAGAELSVRLNEAEARISAARDQAMTHVREIAEATAAEIIAKLTGEAADPKDFAVALEDLPA